jgi:hypothetical protein
MDGEGLADDSRRRLATGEIADDDIGAAAGYPNRPCNLLGSSRVALA